MSAKKVSLIASALEIEKSGKGEILARMWMQRALCRVDSDKGGKAAL